MQRALAILLLLVAAFLRGADAPAPLPPYWVTNSVLRATTNVPPAAVSNLLLAPLPAPRGASLQAYLGRDVRSAAPSPAPTSGVDCCFLPLGFHELAAAATNGVGAAARVLVCDPDVVLAVVWRLRRDLEAGARVPVLVDHAATNTAGRVLATWFDSDLGGMARLALNPAGEAAYAADKREISPAMLELYASTPTVTTNGVAYPSDAYVLPWRVLELSLVRRGRLANAGTTGSLFPLSTPPPYRKESSR